MWIRPETHPCQRSHSDIPEREKQSDYVDLLNNYCLRKKSNETELKCRFHFPFDHCPQTKLELVLCKQGVLEHAHRDISGTRTSHVHRTHIK